MDCPNFGLPGGAGLKEAETHVHEEDEDGHDDEEEPVLVFLEAGQPGLQILQAQIGPPRQGEPHFYTSKNIKIALNDGHTLAFFSRELMETQAAVACRMTGRDETAPDGESWKYAAREPRGTNSDRIDKVLWFLKAIIVLLNKNSYFEVVRAPKKTRWH